MRIPVLLIALLPTFALAQGMEVKLKDPAFTVSIPDLPAFELGPHPNAPRQPTAKLFGSSTDGVSLSVLAPTADRGTTPAQCASWLAGSVMSRFAPNLDSVQILKAGDNAWVVLFPVEAAPVTQLQAYVLSGNGKGHCLEVHVSRTNASDAQRQQWLSGFRRVAVRSE